MSALHLDLSADPPLTAIPSLLRPGARDEGQQWSGAADQRTSCAAAPDSFSQGDYEYLSSPETFPNPIVPHAEEIGMTPFPIMGLGEAQQPLIKAGALGKARCDLARATQPDNPVPSALPSAPGKR